MAGGPSKCQAAGLREPWRLEYSDFSGPATRAVWPANSFGAARRLTWASDVLAASSANERNLSNCDHCSSLARPPARVLRPKVRMFESTRTDKWAPGAQRKRPLFNGARAAWPRPAFADALIWRQISARRASLLPIRLPGAPVRAGHSLSFTSLGPQRAPSARGPFVGPFHWPGAKGLRAAGTPHRHMNRGARPAGAFYLARGRPLAHDSIVRTNWSVAF